MIPEILTRALLLDTPPILAPGISCLHNSTFRERHPMVQGTRSQNEPKGNHAQSRQRSPIQRPNSQPHAISLRGYMTKFPRCPMFIPAVCEMMPSSRRNRVGKGQFSANEATPLWTRPWCRKFSSGLDIPLVCLPWMGK